MLARLLRRRARRHDRDPHRHAARGRSLGLELRLLSGCHPRECTDGTAATFDQARADFEEVWQAFLSKRTEFNFQAWYEQRDWTARKYAMWQRGERLPSQKPSSLMTCRCGEVFDSHRLEETLIHVPHISAAESEHVR
jgi:hypothetical protein